MRHVASKEIVIIFAGLHGRFMSSYELALSGDIRTGDTYKAEMTLRIASLVSLIPASTFISAR